MKQLNLAALFIAVLFTASSCKKEKMETPPVDTTPKLARIDYEGSTNSSHYSYNAEGRLAEVKDDYFTLKYEYPNGIPVLTSYKTQTGTKVSTLSGLTLTGGKVNRLDYILFNALGQPYNPDPYTFEYDANGFQTKKTGSGYESVIEVTNGNMTKKITRAINTGIVTQTYTYEFYTDKPNKFNINYFEQWYDNYPADKSIFGTRNTNLIKRMTYVTSSGTEITDFTYVTNADGYLTGMTTSWSRNGGTPVVSNTRFTYQ